MKIKNRIFYVLLFFIFIISAVYAKSTESVKPANLGLQEVIPIDENVTTGTFENGVTYYIMENKKPEKRATFWLAVNAGSVLENDNQQGLAHLVEHMGFNGTKNFAKHELIDYLESIGMRFGPEINAFTSFDETVYFLNVPTDSAYYVDTGFQILEDWAHQMSLEGEEIDKERGVVIEEWRLGRGARMRMFDKQLPVLFKNSRYAERLPIGKKEIIETCTYETVRSFYKDWYRPDLIAIVAVGDFDKNRIFELMKKHFATIPRMKNPRERIMYPVPDHDEPLFAIATDKEASRTQVSVYFKSEVHPTKTVADYRLVLMESLYNNMLNNRLNELTKKADPPFLYAYSGKGTFVRTKGVYYLAAGVNETGIERGLDAILTEANRVKQYGFTTSEFERTKTEILRYTERAYKERDKTESRRYAHQYVNHFLENEPIPGPTIELALCYQLLPGIKLEEVNVLAKEWITEKNRVVLVNAPEKEDISIPSEDQLLTVFKAADNKTIQPYVDTVSDEPLIANPPKPAAIIEEKYHDKLDLTEWKLANGVRVFLKPTDFKNDQILFDSYSFGGTSLATDKQYMSARSAVMIIQESGVGAFNSIELEKKLTGKVVRVNPYIHEESEGLSGSASPEDMETMFRLIYLYMTAPRKDTEAFQSFLTRIKGFIENRNARPETAFLDTVQVTMTQYHHRTRPWSIKLLDEIDHETAFQFYKNRFDDASDFKFYFVGNFELEKIKPLIQIYLGGLPATNRNESWKDSGIMAPEGVIEKEVYKGMEPKSMVRIIFSGPCKLNYDNYYAMTSLVEVMRIKLREIMREELGGTYGVQVRRTYEKYPRETYKLNIMFGCSPDRVNELTNILFQQIDSLKTTGPGEIYITKVREIQTREHEVNLKENNYWLRKLKQMDYIGWEPDHFLINSEYIKNLSPELIRNAAQQFLNTENYFQAVLYPEKNVTGQ